MRLFILLTGVVFFTLSCSTTPSKIPFFETEGLPLEFKIEGVLGKEEHLIYSASQTKTFQNEQLILEQSEIVEFKTLTETTQIDESSLRATVTTLTKDGPTDLTTMGYPELGESIDYTIAKDSRILRAGNHPEKSLFFIPQLPFPKKPMSKGETWKYSTEWISDDTQSLLVLEIILVLKDIRECRNAICLDVEYSGGIRQPQDAKFKMPFESTLKGKMTYNLKLGQIIYGLQINTEKIQIEGARVQAVSCAETVHSSFDKKPACNPLELPTLSF